MVEKETYVSAKRSGDGFRVTDKRTMSGTMENYRIAI